MTGIKKPDDIIIRFSNYSQKAINAHQIQIHDGKFRPEELSEKGQLFVLADGVDGHNTDLQAKEMAVRVMHESYYSAPSRDIVTSLKNAFKDANTLVHEIFNEHTDRAHLGIACTSLVLTNNCVYVARVGDSSAYRITRQKLQNMSALNPVTLVKKGNPSLTQPAPRLALGVGSEIEPEVNEFALKTGDCFLLCSDRLIDVGVEEIRRIVRSNTPREACQKLIDSARQMGVLEQAEVQVIWVSSVQPTPDSAGDIIKLPFLTKIKLISAAAFLLILTVALLQTIDLERIFPSDPMATAPNNHENTYSSETRSLIAEANAFFDAGELDIALSRYQDLQNIDTLASARIRDIFEIYKDKANLYYQQGYYTAALTFYGKALELEPESTQLASLIASCKKKLGRAPDENDGTTKTAASNSAPNRGDKIRVSKKSSSTRVIPETNKQTQMWDWSTIPDKGITSEKSGIRFLHSSTRSKLLSRNELSKFELELRTSVPNETHGRFGVIIGYQTMAQSPYETFYLISMYSGKTFLLHRYANFKKEILANVTADSISDERHFAFTVRCNGSNLKFYYGEQLIFDWTAPEPMVGRIGLYAGPDTDVTFSNLKFSEIK